MKTSGSEIFGTEIVRTDEYILLAQVMVGNGSTVKEAALEISAIDDMLSILRSASLINARRLTPTGRIRKNSSLLDILDGRIGKLCEEITALKEQTP